MTVNADKSVTFNGTATTDFGFEYGANTLDSGNYILSKGSSDINPNLYLYNYATSSVIATTDSVAGHDNVPFTLNAQTTFTPATWITSGQTFNNAVIKPMIRLARDNDSTYQPYAMTNKEMTPYVQAISNPNLLDNPWFTVNQRGWTTGGATKVDTFTVDRWKIEVNNSDHVVTVNNDGTITLTNNSSVGMYFDTAFLLKDFLLDVGTSYTASVDVVSYSGVVNVNIGLMNSSPWHRFGNIVINKIGINSATGVVPSDFTGTSFRALCFILNAGASITVRAVKLERGTVSTLANDAAPNYQQELAKCQRYFESYHASYGAGTSVFLGYFNTTSQIIGILYTSTPLRTTPTIEYGEVRASIKGSTSVLNVSSMYCNRMANNALRVLINLSSAFSGVSAGDIADVYISSGAITLSADL